MAFVPPVSSEAASDSGVTNYSQMGTAQSARDSRYPTTETDGRASLPPDLDLQDPQFAPRDNASIKSTGSTVTFARDLVKGASQSVMSTFRACILSLRSSVPSQTENDSRPGFEAEYEMLGEPRYDGPSTGGQPSTTGSTAHGTTSTAKKPSLHQSPGPDDDDDYGAWDAAVSEQGSNNGIEDQYDPHIPLKTPTNQA